MNLLWSLFVKLIEFLLLMFIFNEILLFIIIFISVLALFACFDLEFGYIELGLFGMGSSAFLLEDCLDIGELHICLLLFSPSFLELLHRSLIDILIALLNIVWFSRRLHRLVVCLRNSQDLFRNRLLEYHHRQFLRFQLCSWDSHCSWQLWAFFLYCWTAFWWSGWCNIQRRRKG